MHGEETARQQDCNNKNVQVFDACIKIMARLINKAYSLALLLFCYVLSGAAEAAYNVADFGAKPDGRTDSTGAFASAWSAACRRSQAPATVYFFLLSRAAFFTGPMLQQDDASGHPDQHPDRGRRLRLRRRPRHHQPAARGARQLRIRCVVDCLNNLCPYHC